MRLIVGISGASGAVLGYETLRALRRQKDMEIHLVVTKGAAVTLALETSLTLADAAALADYVHDDDNLAAPIASGSFRTDGMIVAPCSMKSLAGITAGYAGNLLGRAADVCLKEGRKLVLVPRETPLSKAHLRNLCTAAADGCVILPPMLTFYNDQMTMEGQLQHIIGKILAQFGLTHAGFVPWGEKKPAAQSR
ncbi:MAG: UbiX family flavin prenyltransferase [Peptococcaceae bacterium]|jgi:4-hydroxy-3-polyprenylbenzoate decarboxylase|nr:UbiX family flavin prenyltransferase [Peptococcaceae bacterium]